MRGPLRALLDVGACGFGKLGVPHEVLRAVEPAPVPVGAHHGADEVGVVCLRGALVFEGAWFDFVRGRCDYRGSRESGDNGSEPHLGVELWGMKPVIGVQPKRAEGIGRRSAVDLAMLCTACVAKEWKGYVKSVGCNEKRRHERL
jgi:hypothetical protein